MQVLARDHIIEAPATSADRLKQYPPCGTCDLNHAAQKCPVKGNNAAANELVGKSGQATTFRPVEILRAPSAGRVCYRCGQVGHKAASCTHTPDMPSSACFKCQQPRHKEATSPYRGISGDRPTATARQATAEAVNVSQLAPTSTPCVTYQLNALYEVQLATR